MKKKNNYNNFDYIAKKINIKELLIIIIMRMNHQI